MTKSFGRWCFALSLISILVVYSSVGTLAFKRSTTAEWYLLKHTLMVVLGLAAMWLAHKIDYRYYSKISRLALWASVPFADLHLYERCYN
ncbi:MAG: hypothetical protein WDO15_22840 [Bacteroidota bacterium]